MSKKSRHNAERRNRLAALRAEVTLTLEDKAKPHHMTYNARKTEQLISDFNRTGLVPDWAGGEMPYGDDFAKGGWTKYDDYADAMSYAMVHGQSITKMVMPST
jgi:hypothetical protein